MSRYADAGVDVNAGYELVRQIKDNVKSTARLGVMGGLGSFGGMFDLSESASETSSTCFRYRWCRNKTDDCTKNE